MGSTPAQITPRLLELTPTSLIVPNLVSIAVTPSNPSVSAGFGESFAATGTYSDSTRPTLHHWRPGHRAIPRKLRSILLVSRPLLLGSTTIEAAVGPVNGSTVLTVTAATLQSISISPTSTSIATGAQIQFGAVGHYSDGGTGDITSSVTWALSSPSVATIASGGWATGVGHGTSNVTTSVSSVTSNSATLSVTTETQVRVVGTFSFANNVRPAGGSVRFTRRAYFDENSVQLLTDGIPVLVQLDGQGTFSIALQTFDDFVPVTPYRLQVFDRAGNFLMERFSDGMRRPVSNGMRYAPNDRRAQGAMERRPAMKRLALWR